MAKQLSHPQEGDESHQRFFRGIPEHSTAHYGVKAAVKRNEPKADVDLVLYGPRIPKEPTVINVKEERGTQLKTILTAPQKGKKNAADLLDALLK